MLLKELTISTIKKYFPTPFYERGYEYYLQERVKKMELTPRSHKVVYITAMVRGSTPYHVDITVKKAANKIHIRGTCSCPIAINCKHVVATLLEALDTPPLFETKPQLTLPIKQDPRVTSWLEELNRAAITPSSTENVTDVGAYLANNAISEKYDLFYWQKGMKRLIL